MLAAWASPEDGSLRLALGEDGTWSMGGVLAHEAVLGSPRVARLADGWAVAWRRAVAGGGVEVRLAVASSTGELSEPLDPGVGRLLELMASGDLVHAVLVDSPEAVDALAGETILFASHPPGSPQPITRSRWDLGAFDTSGPSERRAWWPAPSSQTLDAPERTLSPWWPEPGELRFVVLGAAGPEGPVSALSATGRARQPKGLEKEALRMVAGPAR